MVDLPRPKANAMLICDSVITEERTGKKSLIGIFENINAFKFPCIHHALSVYVKLTGAHGSYKVRLELVDLRGDIVIGKNEIPENITINDPLVAYEIVFNLGGLKFDHPGEYEFRFYANDMIVEHKTFLVRQINPEKK